MVNGKYQEILFEQSKAQQAPQITYLTLFDIAILPA